MTMDERLRLVHMDEAADRIKELEVLLQNCCDDLESMIQHEYRNTLHYPSQKRRYDRDMKTVIDARLALSQHT